MPCFWAKTKMAFQIYFLYREEGACFLFNKNITLMIHYLLCLFPFKLDRKLQNGRVFPHYPNSIMFFNFFTVDFHSNLKDLLTPKMSLRLLYNKLLITWNMHYICFVLSLCSLVTTVSPLLVMDFIPTLKDLGTCQALSEFVSACVEIFSSSWFSCKSLDVYWLFCFTINYLCIITCVTTFI